MQILKSLPLLITTGIFLSFFIAIVAQNQLTEVRANWNQRRCEPLVMLMANMVPDGSDPNINPSDFAAENFNFCIGRFIDASLQTVFAPVMKIFNNQLNVAETVQENVNTLRGSAASLMNPFTSIMDGLWNKFKGFSHQALRIFYKIYSAIDRVMGIITASLFAGMSMYTAIQNTIKFVINVILIILGILVVLVIFLWFVLFPFIPIIITTIGIITATVGGAAGAAAASMRGSFCVAPGTLVAMQKGVWRSVEEIQPGDELEEGIVEGVLETICNGDMFLLHGVKVAGSHLVQVQDSWIFVKDHPDAVALGPENFPDRLFCLNTSKRIWKVKSDLHSPESLILRDWEELPEEDHDCSWEMMVFEQLNHQAIVNADTWSQPGRGLLGPDTQIFVGGKGPCAISEIQVGDWVLDTRNTFTQVLGTYKDTSEFVPRSGPNAAAWCWLERKNIWRHPLETLSKTNVHEGYHLITESGTFVIQGGLWMRDFTEVGWDRIEKTYAFTSAKLS